MSIELREEFEKYKEDIRYELKERDERISLLEKGLDDLQTLVQLIRGL